MWIKRAPKSTLPQEMLERISVLNDLRIEPGAFYLMGRANTTVLCDQTGVLTVFYSSKGYPATLRRVAMRDEAGKRVTFLTNDFSLGPDARHQGSTIFVDKTADKWTLTSWLPIVISTYRKSRT